MTFNSVSDYYYERTEEVPLYLPINLTLGNNQLYEYHYKTCREIELQKIWTVYRGICYKVTPNIKHKTIKQKYGIRFLFSDKLAKTDLPRKIEIYLTSEENSYGVVNSIWKEGNEAIRIMAVNSKYILNINAKTITYLKGDKNHLFYNCLGNMYVQKLKEKSSKLCLPQASKNITSK